jgi:hypothetical protein
LEKRVFKNLISSDQDELQSEKIKYTVNSFLEVLCENLKIEQNVQKRLLQKIEHARVESLAKSQFSKLGGEAADAIMAAFSLIYAYKMVSSSTSLSQNEQAFSASVESAILKGYIGLVGIRKSLRYHDGIDSSKLKSIILKQVIFLCVDPAMPGNLDDALSVASVLQNLLNLPLEPEKIVEILEERNTIYQREK